MYRDSGYREFLRSLFSTSTVLFLGFSFEDAYLNELRAEVLALLGPEGEDPPLAYAIINDVPAIVREHYRRHEGIHILSYDSASPPCFQGFDPLLKAIHDRTSALSHFGRVLAGKQIVWMDPHPENNEYGFHFFQKAVQAVGCLRDRVTALPAHGAQHRAVRRRVQRRCPEPIPGAGRTSISRDGRTRQGGARSALWVGGRPVGLKLALGRAGR